MSPKESSSHTKAIPVVETPPAKPQNDKTVVLNAEPKEDEKKARELGDRLATIAERFDKRFARGERASSFGNSSVQNVATSNRSQSRPPVDGTSVNQRALASSRRKHPNRRYSPAVRRASIVRASFSAVDASKSFVVIMTI